MLLRSILTLLICFGFMKASFAQQVALPKDPDVAAMQEYVDIPVNAYSGIPDISIPLYTVQSTEISVPITISYHSNGIRVTEEASWVGLGWNLSAGGMITREIRDNDDFGTKVIDRNGVILDSDPRIPPFEETADLLLRDPSYTTTNTFDEFGGVQNPSNPEQQLNTIAYLTNCTQYNNCNGHTVGDGSISLEEFCTHANPKDTEPDLFTFSFGGYSGKFIYDNKTHEYVPLTAQAIQINRIDIDIQDLPLEERFFELVPYWEILTPDGMKYIFGESNATRQRNFNKTFVFNCDQTHSGDPTAVVANEDADAPVNVSLSTWYLERIEAPNGDKVTFQYEKAAVELNHLEDRFDTGVNPIPGYSEYAEDRFAQCHVVLDNCSVLDLGPERFERSVIRTAYDRVTLKEIEYKYGKVVFENQGSREDLLGGVKLDKIEISGADKNTPIKSYSFKYTYFESSATLSLNDWKSYIILGNVDPHNRGTQALKNFNEGHYQKRLQLQSISHGDMGASSSSSSSSIPKPYVFEYYEEGNKKLPEKTSLAIDYWGYSNNATANQYLIPEVSEEDEAIMIGLANDLEESLGEYSVYDCSNENTETLLPPANRDTNIDYVGAGLLSKVRYPTGGTLELFYEANEFVDESSGEERFGGGVRIERTELKDGRGDDSKVDILKKYEYPLVDSENGKVWAKLISQIDFEKLFYVVAEDADLCPGASGDPDQLKQTRAFGVNRHSSSQNPIQNSFAGSFVGYTNVIVWDGGMSGGNGKSILEYYNESTFYDFGIEREIPNLPRFYDQRNGNLRKQEDFNASGQTVRELVNDYDVVVDLFWSMLVYNSNSARYSSPEFDSYPYRCGLLYPDIHFYADSRQWVKLTKSTVTQHFYDRAGAPNGDVTESTTYTYNDENFQMASKSILNGDGKYYKTAYTYPVGDGSDADGLAMTSANLASFNIINRVIAERSYVSPNATTNGNQVGGTKTYYKTDNVNGQAIIVPEDIYVWEGYHWSHKGKLIGYGENQATQAIDKPGKFEKTHYPDKIDYDWQDDLLIKQEYIDYQHDFDYYFDTHRRLKKSKQPDGTFKEFTYDGLIRLETIKTYGRAADPASADLKTTETITYHYGNPAEDQNFVVVNISYADGTPDKETRKYFDGLGRNYRTVMKKYHQGADVVTDEIIYEVGVNRISERTHLVGNMEIYEYEPSPLNRLVKTTYPDDNFVEYEYGGSGGNYAKSVYNERQYKSTVRADILGRTVSTTDAIGGTTEIEYDDYGNPILIKTPQGSEYTYTYDAEIHPMTKSIPGGGTINYHYELDRDLLEYQIDPEGNKISYQYDKYDRVTHAYLGDPGQNLMIENTYYPDNDPDGPVTQVKSVKNKILTPSGSFSGYTFDKYKYDAFSRVWEYTYDHHLGSDVTTYEMDKADRINVTTLEHDGYETKTIVQTDEFDPYDRLKNSNFSVSDIGETLLAAYTYNARDQVTTKNIGGLAELVYHYDNDRGWLKRINDPLPGGVMLPSCELTDDEGGTTDDPGNVEVYLDMMTLEDLLNARFDLNIKIFNEEEGPCPIVECENPGTPCTTNDLQVSLDLIHSQFEDQVSTPVEIPCADGTTEIIQVIQLDQLVFPTTLYRVRFCDMSERYLTQSLLTLIPGDYAIVQEVTITAAGQVFEVQINGETFIYKLEQLLTELVAGRDLIIGNYVPCGQPDCNPFISCTPEEIAAQEATLALIEQNTPLVIPDPAEYPVTIYELQLCSGQRFYILEEEMAFFEEASVMVIDTIIVSSLGDPIVIEDEPNEPQYPVDYPNLFHMAFDHQPNGNIDTLQWQVIGRTKMEYACAYDPIDRLTNTVFSEFNHAEERQPGNQYGVPAIGYDGDGNIQGLQRRGLKGLCENNKPIYGVIDYMDYKYEGAPNQLTSINELSSKIRGYKQLSGGSYGYDNSGNMTLNGAKGLTIEYNHLNLPKLFTGAEGTIEITYDASGRKLRKVVTGENGYTKDYVGSIEYKNFLLESVNHAEGRAYIPRLEDNPTSVQLAPRFEFVIRDHLGNTRLAFTDLNHDGAIRVSHDPQTNELLQEHHYYPFGMEFEGPWAVHPQRENAYLYNGKELVDDLDLGWLDYGARWYDPAIGRWNAVDPLAENRNWLNPYNYVQNNPLLRIDPLGLTDYTINGQGRIGKVEGTETDEGPDRLIKGKARYNKKTGELKGGSFIEVDKGSFENLDANESRQVFSTESGENAEKIFNFITEGSDIEFDKIKVETGEGNKETHFYTSYDTKKTEGGTDYVLNLQDNDSDMKLVDITHNHGDPDILIGREGTPNPSGPDKQKAAILTQIRFAHQKVLPTFHIRRNGKNHPYKQLAPNQH